MSLGYREIPFPQHLSSPQGCDSGSARHSRSALRVLHDSSGEVEKSTAPYTIDCVLRSEESESAQGHRSSPLLDKGPSHLQADCQYRGSIAVAICNYCRNIGKISHETDDAIVLGPFLMRL